MRKKQLRQHISNVSKKKKAEIMAKSGRTPTGRRKHKNFGAQNHLNEQYKLYGDHQCDYSIFEASRGTGKRATFEAFIKPWSTKRNRQDKLNAEIKLITARDKKKALQEASITTSNYASTSAFMQSTWDLPQMRVYFDQHGVIVFSQSAKWPVGKKVSDDLDKIRQDGFLPIKVFQKEKPEY